MLHVESVEGNTLEILKNIQALPELQSFSLVGGTALSLKYGHRKSIDIDLFSTVDFNNEVVFSAITKIYPQIVTSSLSNNVGVFAFIDDLKIDLVKHIDFPMLSGVIEIDCIRFFSDDDIAGMKIFAATKRVVKKDYYDMALLTEVIGVQRIIDAFFTKYPFSYLPIKIPRLLLEFDDVESSPDPVGLNDWSWKKVKKTLQKNVNHYLKSE